MAASSNSNQIALAADQEGQVSVSGTVVLLKEEGLTLSGGAAVDYTNFGNYKALKVTDDNNKVQYICSFKGVQDVVKFAITDSSGVIREYPIMQHSFEMSDSLTPLADFPERENEAPLYDASLGGSQLRTQRFKDTYQTETSSYQDRAHLDYLKAARVGDTVSVSFYRGQKIKLKRTGQLFDDGRLAQLTGDSDIYSYLIENVTMPNDERVDSQKVYGLNDVGMWSVRPGFNKILRQAVTSNNKKAVQIFIDAQGFRTGGTSELGWNANTFGDDYGHIQVSLYDKNLNFLSEEYIIMSPDTPGFDLCGRFLGSYVTNYTADNDQFPLYVDMDIWFGYANKEYTRDLDQFWSEHSDFGAIDSTQPDIHLGELLDDPWCLDRQYTDECDIQAHNDNNPWKFYRFIVETTGGSSASTFTTKVFNQAIANQKIQYTGNVVNQTNFIEKSTDDLSGLTNNYFYKTKKFRISNGDRPNMLRTISLTYRSKNPITVRIYTDKNQLSSILTFDGTEANTGTIELVTTTKVIGLLAKTFSVGFSNVGSIPETTEITRASIAYG